MRRWVRTAGSVLPGPRSTPFTCVLLCLLAASAAALRWGGGSDPSVAQWASTNLVNLDQHPVGALVASAFVSEGNITLDFLVVAVACAALERRSTSARTALVVAGGHVIASLVSEGAVRVAIALHSDSRSAARQLDVGISYVMYTALGAALGLLPGRWRRLGAAGAVCYVGVAFVRDPGLTTGGHLLSLAIGMVSWPFLTSARDGAAKRAERRLGRIGWSRVAAGYRLRVGALAALTVTGALVACSPGHYPLGGHHNNAPCGATAHCADRAQPGN